MTDRIRIPDPPAEFSNGRNYHKELDMARFSRVSYLEQEGVRSSDLAVNPDHNALFDQSLGPNRWREARHWNENDGSGFVAYAFVNDEAKRVVIAIRGSDNGPDWSGPNVAVSRDGDLPGMLNLPGPATDSTRAQFANLQEKLLPGDAWHPQFQQALDFAREIRDTYEARGYTIVAVGHSMGGAHSQVVSHTFGWEGRSFDAPGAANIIESRGYRDWLAANGVEPRHSPRLGEGGIPGGGFLNYTVNNSAVSHLTGPHIGERQSISSFVGREGFGSHARYVAGIVGGAVDETPFAGQVAKAAGAGRTAVTIAGIAAHGAHHGVDGLDRHDMDRIVAVFEQAARTGRLPVFGEHGGPGLPPLAKHDPPVHADTDPSSLPAHASTRAIDNAALSGFMEAVRHGDTQAFRNAARDLCATPGARAWLQAGEAQLEATRHAGQGAVLASHVQDPCPPRHAQAEIEGQPLLR